MVSMGRSLDRQGGASRGPDLKLFIKDVRDQQHRKRAVTVRSWSTIQEVKQAIQNIMQVPPNAQRLYFGPLLSSGRELPNHRTLHDAGIYRSGETLLLDISLTSTAAANYSILRSADSIDFCISSSMIDSTPKPLRSLAQKARRGFLMGFKPELVLEGSGGTYFLHDSKKAKTAVFKPADEEPYAENNPRGYVRQAGQAIALRKGVVPGEACMREVAAFLLDHGGFAGVPMTTLTEARHPAFNNNGSRLRVAQGGASIGSHSISPNAESAKSTSKKKVGSFQEFVCSECTMDDISPSKISADEVHKIAILDIRIMNADRNSANLLVRRKRDSTLELVPIDHGFCLRSVADVSWMDWCWLDWPQLKKPVNETHAKYILSLDIEADARLLSEQLNINPDAVDYFRASSRILKAGVEGGLTLFDIANICCRNDDLGEIPSKLEVMFGIAEDLSNSALENGRWHHSAASRALADLLSPRGVPQLPEERASPRSRFAAILHKSASDAHFPKIINNLEGALADVESSKEYPGMAQSSASSDSSGSDAGDAAHEKDECDQWAAALLANISTDRSTTMLEESCRSSSVGSEDDSSDVDGSSKGFWHTRPGSPSLLSVEEEFSTRSPEPSPAYEIESSHCLEPPLGCDGKIGGVRTPVVHFADEASFNSGLSVLASAGPTAKTQQTKQKSLLVKAHKSGMTRSQSYSAIGTLRGPCLDELMLRDREHGERHPDPGGEECDQFRDYFLKFIDLVIVRETKAVVSQQLNHFAG